MTLYVDKTGRPECAENDLLKISHDDYANLGDYDDPNNPGVTLITYSQDPGVQVITAHKLFILVDAPFSMPIVITAVPSGTLDPYDGTDVTGNGQSYIDVSGTTTVVRIVYDIDQCNQAGIVAYDIKGNPIIHPNSVMLYHELSHANDFVTGLPTSEFSAISDENDMRSYLQIELRDPDNHNGSCGISGAYTCDGVATNTTGPPPPPPDCLIASAAYGSPLAPQVRQLNRARDSLARRLTLTSMILPAIAREYYSYSPLVAREMRSNHSLAESIRTHVVAPLLEWYAVIEALQSVSGRRDLERLAGGLAESFSATEAQLCLESFEAIVDGRLLPTNAPDDIRFIWGNVIAVLGPNAPLSIWALVQPLAICASSSLREVGGDQIVDRIGEWLADAPLDAVARVNSVQASELKVIEAIEAIAEPSLRAGLSRRLRNLQRLPEN